MRRSIYLLTINTVGLFLIFGMFHYQGLAIQEILKEVSTLGDSLTEGPRYKTATTCNSTDLTWVLDHPTVKHYMKTRPLPWNPSVIPDKVRAAMGELNAARVPQDDPRLIQLIRDYYIEPPSLLPYNLTYPDREDSSKGQTPFVDSRLGHMVS